MVGAGIDVIRIAEDADDTSPIIKMLAKDPTDSYESALKDFYRKIRPGEPATLSNARSAIMRLFFDPKRYNLGRVGRYKLNSKMGFELNDEQLQTVTLTKEDVIGALKYLIRLKQGRDDVNVDDIDHLGNRRVRSVGELIQNQCRIGLARMEKIIRERMNLFDFSSDTLTPGKIVSAKGLSGVLKDFFGRSQLSQFMDQTNPIAELTHKRRLSSLGPGGLNRDRAGFEVRDVHASHYGRICPIETPEGPNIGLITSLSSFAKINEFGFIETPYLIVRDGVVTDEIEYMTADQEERCVIAQASANLDEYNMFADPIVWARYRSEPMEIESSKVTHMDVSPKQLVSIVTGLIPFLEHDDANRALMGSNMQRQGVPLLKPEAPIVGTGLEARAARDSGAVVVAQEDGVVEYVDGSKIVISPKDNRMEKKVYLLKKFLRSNSGTCINQQPLVEMGDQIKAGDVIADGPATDKGEAALGRNVLVAFMPWFGYNFEDAIIISEKLLREDAFTSIYIEEFELTARDTKLGKEEITRDIPNVSEEALVNLGDDGIIRIGAEVKPGDILVGKVTPKGETPVTPEEKLLRAIFGEKASDVRDTSLRVQPGVSGTVVEVRVFSRRGVEKDERALAIERAEINRLAADRDTEKGILERAFFARLKQLLLDQKAVGAPKGAKTNVKIDEAYLEALTTGQWRQLVVDNDAVMAEIEAMRKQHDEDVTVIQKRFEDKVEKVRRGDELPTGVLKTVKVFIATKRKIQAGDKMAGRHGNKGVVSVIVPEEDMPHLEDGTPVDIVLNPLGVPSRMNVGQILETHLGWAAAGLGKQISQMLGDIYANNKNPEDLKKLMAGIYQKEADIKKIDNMDEADLIETAASMIRGVPMATPVFDGAHEDDIIRELQRAKLNTSGQVTLIDGRTGEPFERPVTVGYIYMLKLSHMVDDKIHARSVGPYSLVTQQPLGGKAQFGGQRFGEMEVWALEAYGAAYTLQEMLTVKSDDVSGRTKVYEAIVRGEDAFESGIPESFNVLVKELRSLSLNLEFGE